MGVSTDSLSALNARIVNCERCPRLRLYDAEVARVKRRAYADQEYWGKPVPSFGDPNARFAMEMVLRVMRLREGKFRAKKAEP